MLRKPGNDFLKMKILILISLSISCSQPEKSITTSSEMAKAAYDEGVTNYYYYNFEHAIKNFQKAVTLDPLFRMGYCRLSMAYYHFGDYQSALEYNRLANKQLTRITRNEDLFISWWNANLGNQFHTSRTYLTGLIEKNPFNKELQHLNALNLKSQTMFPKAEQEWLNLLKQDENYLPAYVELGELALQQEKFSQALDWFNKARLRCDECAVTYLNLGKAFFLSGDYANAELELKTAIQLSPGLAISYLYLVDVYRAQGQYNQALKIIDKSIRSCYSDSVHFSDLLGTQAELYILKNEFARADSLCALAFQYDSKNEYAYYLSGLIKLKQSRFDAAFVEANHIKLLAERNQQESERIWTYHYLLLSRIFLKQNQLDNARETGRFAFKKNSLKDRLIAVINLCEIYYRQEQYNPAIELCESILRKNPNYPLAHFWLAQLYEKMGELEMARNRYKQFLYLYRNADEGLEDVRYSRERVAILEHNYPKVKSKQFARDEN